MPMNNRSGLIIGSLITGFIVGCGVVILTADEVYENFRIPAGWTPTILLDEDNAMRELVRAGEIQSPETLVERIENQFNGRVSDIDFDRGFLTDYYEFEFIDEVGREWDLDIEAGSDEIIERRRDWD